MTKLSVATTKRNKDSHEQWQEKTHWPSCVACGPTADYAARIQTGDHVFLDDELIVASMSGHSKPTSGPTKVQWTATEIVIDFISVIDASKPWAQLFVLRRVHLCL
jgi:Single-strand binding protein family